MYHLTAPDGWKNDPQRPILLDGRYHYYYLYNADYPRATGTAWRLATTTDSVTFHDEGVAIPKHTQHNGDVWSGSLVVDETDSAGFGANAVIALATQPDHAGADGRQAQFLWYSTDGGKSFQHYSDQPVLPNPGRKDFRDPKIIRDDARRAWIVLLAEGDHIGFYRSTDLKRWEPLSRFATAGIGILECPDLFRIEPTDGTSKWILGASADGRPAGLPNTFAYWTGTFDGVRFHADAAEPQWLDHGHDWYAAVTWEHRSGGDADPQTRLALAWMNNWAYPDTTPTWEQDGFNGTDSVVRELRLHQQPDGTYRLHSRPVRSLDTLVTNTIHLPDAYVESQHRLDFQATAYEISTTIRWTGPAHVGLRLRASTDGTRHATVGVRDGHVYTSRRHTGHPDSTGRYLDSHSPLADGQTEVRLRILIDRTTMEVFVDDGRHVHSNQIFPQPDDTGVTLFSEGTPAWFTHTVIREIGERRPSSGREDRSV
ncbi:glycoside hydrolase family 32 protein [Micromonospora echinospora]|uniref:glycoside hydrolase family 32 protein n=1 Tax=Micromonospora echinospora TaxID=1877 RepID=UPI0037985121